MSESGLDVTPFFAVPIASTVLPNHEPLCDALETLFLAKEAEGEQWRHQKHIDTMHGDLFESRFDLFRWPDEPVKQIAAAASKGFREREGGGVSGARTASSSA